MNQFEQKDLFNSSVEKLGNNRKDEHSSDETGTSKTLASLSDPFSPRQNLKGKRLSKAELKARHHTIV